MEFESKNRTPARYKVYALCRMYTEVLARRSSTMPTPQPAELHHNPNARFQSGNRVYRVVILGQGGVGKSGEQLAS